jgi:hypothetical protein
MRAVRATACATSLAALAACGGGGGGAAPSPQPTPVETPSSYAYLQDVSASSAVVCRYAPGGELYSLEWSLAATWSPLGRATETEVRSNHALRMGPLAADTSYRYRLRAPGGSLLAEGVVSTAPPALSRPVTFALISDSGWQGQAAAEGQVAEAIRLSNPAPELLLHAGDVIYPSGERENYPSGLFQPFSRVIDHVPFFPTVGNHDLETEKGAAWNEMFVTPANNPQRNPRYYSFDWGDVHFTAIDVASAPHAPGSLLWSWAAEDLRATRAAWKVVYLHYPPWSCGLNGSSADVQRTLVPLFEATAVDVVIGGHDHSYQRFHRRAGILYLVSAGGGAPPDPTTECPGLAFARSVNHFLRGRAEARTLLLEAVGIDGVVIESMLLQH